VARTKTAKKKKLTEEALKLKEEALQEQPIQDAAPAPTPATGEEVAQAQADLAADPNAQVPVDEAPVEETAPAEEAPAEEAAPQEDPMFTPPAPGYVPAGWVKIEDLASAVAQATGDTVPAETAPDTQAMQNSAENETVAPATPTAATEEPLVQGGEEVQQTQPQQQFESVENTKERLQEDTTCASRRELLLAMLEDAGLDIDGNGNYVDCSDVGFFYDDDGGCLHVMILPGLDSWHISYRDEDNKENNKHLDGHGWEDLIDTLINELDAPGLKDLKAEDYYECNTLHESVEITPEAAEGEETSTTEGQTVQLTEAAEAPAEEDVAKEETSADSAIVNADAGEEAPIEEAEPIEDTTVEDDTVEGPDPESESTPLEDALDGFTDEAEKAGAEYDASYELPEDDEYDNIKEEDLPEDPEELDFVTKITNFVDDIKQSAQEDKEEAQNKVEEVNDDIEEAASQFDNSSAFLRSLLSNEDDGDEFNFDDLEAEEEPIDKLDDLEDPEDDFADEDFEEEDFEDGDFEEEDDLGEDAYEERIPVELPSRSMRAHEAMYDRRARVSESYESFLPAGSEHFANEENLVTSYQESAAARRRAIADFRASLRENRARTAQLRSNRASKSVDRFSEALSGRDVMKESLKNVENSSPDSRSWLNNRFTKKMEEKDSLNWKDLLNNGFLG
jgi:hypothetical protein